MGQLEDKKLKSEYSVEEALSQLNITSEEIEKFEEEGVFNYLDAKKHALDHKNFERLKSAVALYRELGVNLAGIDIILSMKEKMSHLQMEFNDLLENVQKKLGSQIKKDIDELKNELD